MLPTALQLLAGLPVFRGLGPAQLARIAAAGLPVNLEKGEWLLRRGAQCTAFYAVASGSIKVAYHSPQGAEKVVEIVRPGQSFGEALLFVGQPWLVSARALADSLVLAVPGQALMEEMAREPALARGVLAGLSRRLHKLLEDLGANAMRSGRERIVAYLLRGTRADAHAPLEVELPRKGDLASRLSMTPEHFSRVLHRLAALGLVQVKGRRVRVPDPVRLRKV